MRMLLILVSACASERTQRGDTGNPSAPATSAGVVWVDADGNVASGIVTLPGGLFFVDRGFLWRVDPEFGLFPPVRETGFADDACEEEVVLNPIPPFYVAQLDNGTTVAALDPLGINTPNSVFDGDCVEIAGGDLVTAPVADLLIVDMPSFGWVLPLHPEEQ